MPKRIRSGAVCSVVLAAVILSGCAKTVRQNTDDATITTRVKTALLNDKDVNGRDIAVDTANGVVTLSGTVRSAQQRDRAIAIARGTTGVIEVQSSLQISG